MADEGAIDVAVVGSANVDLSIEVDDLPRPGETVLGGDVLRGAGGKGANQAVAAARLGARVAFIGRVGDDEDGRWLRERLELDAVDVRGLLTTREVSTGLAVIAVDADGENSIVVSSGANFRLSADDVRGTDQLLTSASVVLTQLEIPVAAVEALRPLVGGRLVLNPAPAQARNDLDLDGFDVVVPNRGELAQLAGGTESTDLATVADQARALKTPLVIVTLGSQGAMAVFNDGRPSSVRADVVVLPAVPVDVVDTTAAGDSFCGALAVALAEGAEVIEAMGWAIRVAGQTVSGRGAQESLPRRDAVGSWSSDGV